MKWLEASLTQYIKLFDSALDRRWIKQSDVKAKQMMMNRMQGFYHLMDKYHTEIEKCPVLNKLAMVVCRQTADLSARLQTWSCDALMASSKTLESLFANVQTQLIQRSMSQKLANQTQNILESTCLAGNRLGLGTVI